MDRIFFPVAPILNFIGQNGIAFSAIVLALLVLYFFAPRMGFLERLGRKRRADQRRSKEAKRDSLERTRAIEQEEFSEAIGMSKSRYVRLTLMISIIIAALSFAALQSSVVSFFLAFFFFRWRTGRAASRILRLRAGLLAYEVLPMASTIGSSLSTGMSLSQAISDATRGERGKGSPLKAAMRRALADARGLEDGLREEEGRAHQELIKEFFEILSDGATAARNQAATANTLDKFADINLRLQTRYQLALRVTGQARGTRTMLVGIIPFVMVGSILVSGPDLMLHTVGGQVIISLIFIMILLAIGLTNRVITGVTKGF